MTANAMIVAPQPEAVEAGHWYCAKVAMPSMQLSRARLGKAWLTLKCAALPVLAIFNCIFPRRANIIALTFTAVRQPPCGRICGKI